jgi:hypothetical protein
MKLIYYSFTIPGLIVETVDTLLVHVPALVSQLALRNLCKKMKKRVSTQE